MAKKYTYTHIRGIPIKEYRRMYDKDRRARCMKKGICIRCHRRPQREHSSICERCAHRLALNYYFKTMGGEHA